MAKYTCEIEKTENGEKITRDFTSDIGEKCILLPVDILRTVAVFVDLREMRKGEITELKVNRDKNGSVRVSITGAQDRIFAKVWRADNA